MTHDAVPKRTRTAALCCFCTSFILQSFVVILAIVCGCECVPQGGSKWAKVKDAIINVLLFLVIVCEIVGLSSKAKAGVDPNVH